MPISKQPETPKQPTAYPPKLSRRLVQAGLAVGAGAIASTVTPVIEYQLLAGLLSVTTFSAAFPGDYGPDNRDQSS